MKTGNAFFQKLGNNSSLHLETTRCHQKHQTFQESLLTFSSRFPFLSAPFNHGLKCTKPPPYPWYCTTEKHCLVLRTVFQNSLLTRTFEPITKVETGAENCTKQKLRVRITNTKFTNMWFTCSWEHICNHKIMCQTLYLKMGWASSTTEGRRVWVERETVPCHIQKYSTNMHGGPEW